MRRYVQMLTSTWDNNYLVALVKGITRRFKNEDIGLHIFNAYDEIYEKDFYIARTKFSDILKESPEDSLVRWYVFEADRYLNESTDDEEYRYIHL